MNDMTIPVQGSPQWVRQRIGCLTASNMWKALGWTRDGPTKNGKPSESRLSHMMELVAERQMDAALDHFVSPAMEHGILTEPEAAAAYEELSGEILMPAPFILHPEIEHFGGSPDRLLGDAGLVEIKCPNTTTFVRWVVSGQIPEIHKPQMLAQLAVTQRQFCDFVAYDPRIKTGKKIFIRRFEPKAEEIQAVEEAARTFLAETEALFQLVTEQQWQA